MKRADYWIVIVSSMEQFIGTALTTVVSVMLPMLQLTLHPEMPSFLQGIVGAAGLIGIGVGSPVIGKVSDKHGYLFTFRLCPVLIMLGSLICIFFTNIPCLILGLFVAGLGIGGGYSLDSAYISELLPPKWRLLMVGVAKSTCALGTLVACVACYFMLKCHPTPDYWNRMMLVVLVLGAITLLMRVHWAESPKWLLDHGQKAAAEKAAQQFLGSDAQIALQDTSDADDTPAGKFSVKDNWKKIIFSGIPWACEGLGVYGFGVFLPVMVMALGFDKSGAEGIPKVLNSVEVSILVNFFIIPGFILGIFMQRKVNNVKMLAQGFWLSAAGLLLLLASYELHWPVWIMLLGFFIFEISLNAGPHLITYIIPARVYPVSIRGEGNGIAAFLGKVGAIGGVLLMPMLLSWGGMMLVLIVSAAVMVIGALISRIYGRALGLL